MQRDGSTQPEYVPNQQEKVSIKPSRSSDMWNKR